MSFLCGVCSDAIDILVDEGFVHELFMVECSWSDVGRLRGC